MEREAYCTAPDATFLSTGRYREPETGELDKRINRGVKTFVEGLQDKLNEMEHDRGWSKKVSISVVFPKKTYGFPSPQYSVGSILDQPYCPAAYMLPFKPVPGIPYCQPKAIAHVLLYHDDFNYPKGLGFSDYKSSEDRGGFRGVVQYKKFGALQAILPDDLAILKEQYDLAKKAKPKEIAIHHYHKADTWVFVVAPKAVMEFLTNDPEIARLYPMIQSLLNFASVTLLMDPTFTKLSPEVKMGYGQMVHELQWYQQDKATWQKMVDTNPKLSYIDLDGSYGVLNWLPDDIQNLYVSNQTVPSYLFRSPFSSFMTKISTEDDPTEDDIMEEGAASAAEGSAAGAASKEAAEDGGGSVSSKKRKRKS
jgi:hypothetical protein